MTLHTRTLPITTARVEMKWLAETVPAGEIVYVTQRRQRVFAMAPADFVEAAARVVDLFGRHASECDAGDLREALRLLLATTNKDVERAPS